MNGSLAATSVAGTIYATTVPSVPSTYSGFAFIDPLSTTDPTDAAVKTSNDTPLQGVIISLTGTSSNNQAVSLQTSTASDGSYSFTGLSPGTYVITESVPPGFVGAEAVAGGAVVGTNTITFTIPAAGGVASTNNNFAFSGIAPGGISQRSYLSSTSETSTNSTIIVSYSTTPTASVDPSVSPPAQSTSPPGAGDTASSSDPAEKLLLAIDSAFAQI
jgi:hypothetical protein